MAKDGIPGIHQAFGGLGSILGGATSLVFGQPAKPPKPVAAPTTPDMQTSALASARAAAINGARGSSLLSTMRTGESGLQQQNTVATHALLGGGT